MSEPNCSITLTFYEESQSFSYFCTQSSRGWEVQSDGSIHPPPRSRIIKIRLHSYPAGAVFAGFQLVENPATFRTLTEVWHAPPELGVTVTDPSLSLTSPVTALTLDFGGQTNKLFYRLAVANSANSQVLYWDDPKIYNDGSE